MNLPEYLQQQLSGSIRLAGSRVGLEHLVEFYNQGYSPEMLLAQFPTLGLATIHKTIAFYLEHAVEVDAYAAKCHAAITQQRTDAPAVPSLFDLRQRMNQISNAAT